MTTRTRNEARVLHYGQAGRPNSWPSRLHGRRTSPLAARMVTACTAAGSASTNRLTTRSEGCTPLDRLMTTRGRPRRGRPRCCKRAVTRQQRRQHGRAHGAKTSSRGVHTASAAGRRRGSGGRGGQTTSRSTGGARSERQQRRQQAGQQSAIASAKGVDRLVLGTPRSGGDGWRDASRQGSGAGPKTTRPGRQ